MPSLRCAHHVTRECRARHRERLVMVSEVEPQLPVTASAPHKSKTEGRAGNMYTRRQFLVGRANARPSFLIRGECRTSFVVVRLRCATSSLRSAHHDETLRDAVAALRSSRHANAALVIVSAFSW
jgi:hypothetical protein